VKKRIWLILVIALLVVVLGTGTVYAAGGGIKVFDRGYVVQIEAIEVIELTDPITSGIKPGQPIELRYQIKNHDSQKHWNIRAELIISPAGVGLESRWFIEEENTGYAPGTPLLIPSSYYRTLKVTFFPTEDMTINVRIYRTTSEEGKG